MVYEPVSKFPAVRRDLALLIDEQVTFAEIEQLSRKSVKHILQDVHLFDIYKGDKLGAGKKSYAVAFRFQDAKKTLTDKEVDKVMRQLIAKFESDLGAILR